MWLLTRYTLQLYTTAPVHRHHRPLRHGRAHAGAVPLLHQVTSISIVSVMSDVNVCMLLLSAIAILDNDGNRILAKYYDTSKFPTLKEQTKFEKFLFRKTVKASNEIIMLDGLTILYRSSVDIFCYVMGSSYENELILLSALECLFTTLNNLLRKEFEKKALLGEIT